MLGYLSADIICSGKQTAFRERSSRKTVGFDEQIKDKYPSIFRPKGRLLWNVNRLRIFNLAWLNSWVKKCFRVPCGISKRNRYDNTDYSYYRHSRYYLGSGPGTPRKIGRRCEPASQTLTLFMTKICDIPCPIYDLTKKLKPFITWTLYKNPVSDVLQLDP